jgi:hypothetical protein
MIPEGTRAIVEQAAETAAQTLFSAADVPLARAEELLEAIQGTAVRAVLEMRIEQMVKHGHTAAKDDDLPIGWLPREARDYAAIAMHCVGTTAKDRNLPRARRSLAKTAALCLAAIDRLDRAVARGEK